MAPRDDGGVHELRDGSRVHVRPIAPEDRDALAAGFARLSPESRFRRFLSPKKDPSIAPHGALPSAHPSVDPHPPQRPPTGAAPDP